MEKATCEFQNLSLSNLLAKFKTFLVEKNFIQMRIKNRIHINGFALSLGLKQRLEAAQKWPNVLAYKAGGSLTSSKITACCHQITIIPNF